MSTFICGDLQSCFASLEKLLEIVNYKEDEDRLIFAGDLINRGPDTLQTMKWLYEKRHNIELVLGNHDLHFLAVFYGIRQSQKKDTLDSLLNFQDVEKYVDWLCSQPFIIEKDDFIVAHAGLYPDLSIDILRSLSRQAEKLLQGKDTRVDFLRDLFTKPTPLYYSEDLTQEDKLIFFISSVTRMRAVVRTSPFPIDLKFKGSPYDLPEHLIAWQDLYKGKLVYHGHWAALGFKVWSTPVISIDTGCVWGGYLSMIRHEDKQLYQIKGKNLPFN